MNMKTGKGVTLKIDSMIHVAVRAKNLERTLGFYTETLGFPETLRYNYTDGTPLCVYVRVADQQFIEIFGSGRGDRGPDRLETAIIHFCLVVQDIEATARTLEEAGVPLSRELHTPEGRLIYVEDPDGNTIEFSGRDGAASQLAAAEAIRRGEMPVVVQTSTVRPLI
jgi:catechol 2,3-dioxygenase-like lactoylglutathione lyase family enzyme